MRLDLNKLEQLLKVKEREKDEAMHIKDTHIIYRILKNGSR